MNGEGGLGDTRMVLDMEMGFGLFGGEWCFYSTVVGCTVELYAKTRPRPQPQF